MTHAGTRRLRFTSLLSRNFLAYGFRLVISKPSLDGYLRFASGSDASEKLLKGIVVHGLRQPPLLGQMNDLLFQRLSQLRPRGADASQSLACCGGHRLSEQLMQLGAAFGLALCRDILLRRGLLQLGQLSLANSFELRIFHQ